MEFVVFVIPFVVALFLLCFFRRETVWWEYLVLIVPSLLLALLLEFCFKSYNTSDTEYLGSYVTKLRHTDAWNEWHHKTCYRHVRVGKHSHSIPYDCSYCEEHPERWIFYESDGSENYVDQELWEKMRKRFGVQGKFVDMGRHYYTRDGDAQDYEFPGDWKKSWTLSATKSYDNPVLGSRSLFKISEIPEDSAESMGLYSYPKCPSYSCYGEDQECILGIKPSSLERTKIHWFNGTHPNIRVYILAWPSSKYGPKQAELQRSLWSGGNRNELIVCLGLQGRKIDWVQCFSWEDKPVVSVETKSFLKSQKTLDLLKLGDFLESEAKKWVPKDFSEDFGYLSIEISDTQYIWLIILIAIYNIGMSTWVVLNDYKNDEDNSKKVY